LPNVAKAIKLIHDNNYLVVVISNQGGLAKKIFTINDLTNVNIEIQKQLKQYD
jgi:histidinol phosphatase-like enzyme